MKKRRTKKPDPWTDEQMATLKIQWLDEGLSMDQISKRTPGRTRNAIASKIARMGMVGLGERLPGQRFPGDRPTRFASPLALGLTFETTPSGSVKR